MSEILNLNGCNELSQLEISTILHAAEISPFINERSIGPDLESWHQRSFIQSNAKNDSSNNENVENEQEQTIHFDNKISKDISSLSMNLSYDEIIQLKAHKIKYKMTHSNLEFLQNSLLMQSLERKRKKDVHNEVTARNEILLRRSIELKDKCIKTSEDWMLKKRYNEKEILMKAEKLANDDREQVKQSIKMLHDETQQKIQNIIIQGLTDLQIRFRNKYENIHHLIVNLNKEILIDWSEYYKKLKNLIDMFTNINDKLKTDKCGITEIVEAEKICISLDNLEQFITAEIERANREKQNDLTNNEALTTESAVSESESGNTEIINDFTLHPSKYKYDNDTRTYSIEIDERLDFFVKVYNNFQIYVEKYIEYEENDKNKALRFALKKAVNLPINAITGVNQAHIEDKFEKLYNLLIGKPFTDNNYTINLNDFPNAREFCLFLMCSKFLSKCETEFSASYKAAFPFATIIVTLWKLFPEFGELFLGCLYDKSPLLVPLLIEPTVSDEENVFKSIGYRFPNGVIEKTELFLKRQCGLARLYAAIMTTSGRKSDTNKPHPHTLDQAWRWLTNFLNLAPLPDISASLLHEMLIILGADMLRIFGIQFYKIIIYIRDYYIPNLNKITQGGSCSRLQTLIEKWLNEKQIAKVDGVLSINFW